MQFHGDETQEYIDNFKDYLVWKAIRISEKKDISKIESYHVDGILLDSKIEGFYGGSGKSFDWNLIKRCKYELYVYISWWYRYK
ncbi:N-(5'-phospho-ribosyl) anthranilate isomerase [Thermoanaerobacterium thermosaccharolyticum]|uniref:phosphoribosylanthranilate isomerase n=1 Tax=Thermoanaerobacterium thermosaccharolyticum TaxID=1517 RepID=A0A223I3C2_THETR|nr:N-(5'-phospho-ribosyl) anthranilate isomerase [Thermoanaerobacterium thermosaccharolyticum]